MILHSNSKDDKNIHCENIINELNIRYNKTCFQIYK